MGIIISTPWRATERTLDTPAGDVREIDRRISDYLDKIKSDATTASIFRVRDAHLAGRPKPPIDMTADIRARVPEEMYPPVLVADTDDGFDDFDGGYGQGHIVSQAFRDAVESLDKDVHQFVPIEIRRKDGGLHDKRPFYILRVTRLLDTINLDESPQLQRAGGNLKNEPVTERTMFHLGDTTFAVHADRIAGMGLWRDVRSPMHVLVSQHLIDLIKARGLTGWRARSTFTEL
ncbi:hypothetical protein OEZ60_01480 [Defluviimonas sp. WL0024]|uniref:Immunity MXAN-0049 protein domain-containing protein n=1 Tax=Albidovulum salinarum TaxID=2984153 RepID=A0ABT2WYC5_9RHOB|nr:DUF1629 domain-containing protein [Defluviimonas sp. WL0024]MCU9846677.1 hypothetical protein [Defluviimonas sp. WL0024]